MTNKTDKRILKKIFNQNILSGPLFIVLATMAGYFFKYTGIPETNIAIMYLLAVVAISIFTQSYVVSVCYSVMATLAFNYFFTAPYMAFEITNASYIITFAVMVTVSLIITMLTQIIKKNAAMANQRAEDNQRMYAITSEISVADSFGEIISISARNISEICNAEVILVYSDVVQSERIYNQHRFVNGVKDRDFTTELADCQEFRAVVARYENDTMFSSWKSDSENGIQALLCMPVKQAYKLELSKKRIIAMILENATMAAERKHATERHNRLLRENERERYRNSLLRAISHDLRTPLSGIMGTSEMIMGMTDKYDDRYMLAQEIIDDAIWLHSLMENILNLTRLEDKGYYIIKQPEAVEEIIAVVLERFEKRAQDRKLIVNIPDELMIVPMDAKLIVQVLMNLLDNSLKHTTQGQEISLSVTKQGENACFTVQDRGEGIAREDIPYIFQMYYTSQRASPDSKKGMGLGLAICDAVVKAHGGSISAANHPLGGAIFTFTLPMEDNDSE